MIAWTHLRAICLVLLFVPIVHLVYLVSQDTLASLNASPEAWADEMAAYQRQDEGTPLPNGPVEIIGGHRVKLWEGLDNVLAPQPVLMRGLGNATVDDILYYYPRLVGYYRPQTLVFLPGDSEFHIRDAKAADELFNGIRQLAETDQKLRPEGHFYVFAPLQTPLHPEDRAKVAETTRLLSDWAADQPGVSILDANPLLSAVDGKPDPTYFRFDGVNLNEHGYLRLSMLLKTALEAQNPPKTGP
ncbi:hypothetical protein [Haliea sp. E17]|uniref:hypothetical protein n=1 Tax=Haliea sp. E17 TaxID=3401576 RepID=UPI003AAFD721